MVLKQLAAFIIGGILTTFLVGPLIISAFPIMLLLLVGLVIISFIVPGGWLFSWLALRAVSLPLHFKIGRYMLVLITASMIAFVVGVALGHVAQNALMFISGGLVTLFSFTPPSIVNFQKPGSRIYLKRSEPKMNKFNTGKMFGRGLELSDLHAGILVMGDRCIDVARALIKNIVDSGLRVVIIGGTSKIIPQDVRIRGGIADKINIIGDMLNDHRSIESFAYSYALANRLRNDDIPLIINACMDNLVEVQSGKLRMEEFLKTMPDKIQDRRASLIKALVNITEWFSEDGLKLTEAAGDWQALYISVRNLPYRQAMFAMAYAILILDLDAVLVLHLPELLLKDVNLLAYDSREPWERLFNALDHWRVKGLILISKSPILSQQTLHLCQTHIASKMSEYFRPLDGRTREIYEAARTLNDDEVVVYSSRGLFKLKLKIPNPTNIPPPKKIVVASEKSQEVIEEHKEAEEEVEPTLLEKFFNESVVDVARILEQARNGLANVSENDKQLIKELEEKGFITSLGGVYYTSATGEESLSEYQKAVRERRPPIKPVIQAQVEGKRLEEMVLEHKQTIIDSEKTSSRLDECMATYYMAESLFRQGRYGQCVMNCYEFMVNALKNFYQIGKGHLDDIVEMLIKKDAETGLTIQEARDAKTLLIEASKSVKEGRQVSLTSAQRMLKYARKVLESLQKIGGGESG